MTTAGELITTRLRLRKFTPADAEFTIALVNDPAWLRFIGDRKVRTPEDAVAYIARMEAMHAEHGHGALLMEWRETGKQIGMAGLFRRPGLELPDVGFALLPEYYGQGFAFEAAQAVLRDARGRLGLSRVGGITIESNVASIRLLEKLGLHYERTLRLPGGTEDVRLYVVEW